MKSIITFVIFSYTSIAFCQQPFNQNSYHTTPSRQNSLDAVNEIKRELEEENKKAPPKRTYNGQFPMSNKSNSYYKARSKVYKANFEELKLMLEGRKSLDLIRAVFLSEYLTGQTYTFEQFKKMVNEYVDHLKYIAKREGISLTSNAGKHYIIQKLFTEPTKHKDGHEVPSLIYDFEDVFGEENIQKTFVSKLMIEGSGQCRSMPLFYQMLAQELGAECYLSFAPKHSYVKFPINGILYNFETTNGKITTDSWMTGSGMIRSEAIKSKIYLDSIGTKKTIAYLAGELLINYRMELGFEHYLEDGLKTCLKYFPNNIQAHLEMSNVKTALFDYDAYMAGCNGLNELHKYPKQEKQYQNLQEYYAFTDNLGYMELTQEQYKKWFNSVDESEQKQLDEQLKNTMLKNVKKLD